jgi:hypothetical protein
MKNVNSLVRVAIVAVGLMLNAAYGAAFNFSYIFGDGLNISGALSGTQNGLFVDNVSNVTLFFNGVPAPGVIFSSRYDSASPNSYINGPIISFDVTRNNFVFSNSNIASGDFSYNSIFYILNKTVSSFDTAAALSTSLGAFGSQDLPSIARSWSLAASTVPEGGITFALLGAALAGMIWLRPGGRKCRGPA